MASSTPAARSDWAVLRVKPEPSCEVRDIVIAFLEGVRQVLAAATPTAVPA
jgi:hypothetical protein